jgi:glycosyltransferase involved in cell wall biosynthesis
LKVLHVELGRYMYGGAGQVKYLLDGLGRYPGEHVLVCEQQSELAKAFRNPAVKVYHVKLGLLDEVDFRLIPQLRRIIRAEKPDLLHVHCRRDDYLSARAGRLENVPLILSRRMDDPPSAFDRRLKFPLFDRIIVISRGIEAVMRRAGVSPDRMSCVSDGVDIARYRPQDDRAWFLKEFALEPGRPVLGVIASLIPRKGHQVLLDALPAVLSGHPKLCLLVFGKGRLEKSLRRTILERGMQDNVRLEGYRTDIERIVPCLDLLVHPAWREGLGVCILEAAASGVPIVASRVGGIVEAVRHGENGYLVEPGDSSGFAAAINSLLDQPELHHAFGQASRALATEHFSVERMVEGNYGVYRDFMASRETSARSD